MDWQKKYRWSRTWGDELGLGSKPHEDYVAHDGESLIGRDQQTLKAGKWMWSIQYPKAGMPMQPNSGWEPTAAEAAKVVEEAWDEQIRRLTGPA
ncbi:MAG: hypothetical protein ACK4QP_04135 [Pseudorhizobium sp.]